MSDGVSRGLTRKAFLQSAVAFATLAMSGVRVRAAEKAPETGTRLVLLGTGGGPILRKLRSQPSNLLIVDGAPYLIDLGYGCLRQLAFKGIRPVDVVGAFITHHHLDHNADIASLVAFDWLQQRKAALPILGPFGTEQMVKAALDYHANTRRIFSAEAASIWGNTDFVQPKDILKEGEVYKDSHVTVRAVFNTHFAKFYPGEDRSVSYRFDTKDRSIVFTGDTGYSDAVIALAKGADILVTEIVDPIAIMKPFSAMKLTPEAMKQREDHMLREHLPPEDVGRMAAKAKVKKLVLTHFAPGLDSETDMRGYTDGIAKYYKGPVIVGQDLLEI